MKPGAEECVKADRKVMNHMRKNLAIVGVQWGDEGKGKIVDILSEKFDCVARYQGGHNAGHTVKIGDQRFVLHLIPSGIFQEKAECFIGSGVVLDPAAFLEELSSIHESGARTQNRLFISNRCHVILPYHRAIEAAAESQLGDGKIGTTLRGIGPAYQDKVARLGIRVCDLFDTGTLAQKIRSRVDEKNRALVSMGSEGHIDAAPIIDAYAHYGEALAPYVVDVAAVLNARIRSGKSVLFEGAQGTLLDVDHGTFPFVTSSSASAGGVASGLGVSPKYVHQVVGISKAYSTRVGSGPFPTELSDDTGELLRERGREFGATTGRPRRCGWFDGPAGRYSAMINGLDSIVITKVDVLDTLAEIPVCTGYKYKGALLTEFPPTIEVLSKVEPVYRTLKGWQKPTEGIRNWEDFPVATQDYLKFLADYLETQILIVSTGAEREETVWVGSL